MIVVNHLCFTITEKRDSFEVTLRVPDGRLRFAMTERTGYPFVLRKPVPLAEVERECDQLARAIGW